MVIRKFGDKVSLLSVSSTFCTTTYKTFIETYFPRIFERVERKKSLRRLTSQWCDKVKAEKLAEYQNQLNNEKDKFLKSKVETLEWAKKEEIECGVPPTITDADIEAARKQLEEWEAQKSIPK